MTYRIQGLDPVPFKPFFAMDTNALSENRAHIVEAAAPVGFPCRVTLRDADVGERLCLFHYVSHDSENAYRNAYAIYVRENAHEAAVFVDEVPPVFMGRPLALRCFNADGMLCAARLVLPGDDPDAALRDALDNQLVAYIDVHNAAHGCFSARVERD